MNLLGHRADPRDTESVAERTSRRVTARLIPFLMLIYMLAYLDRANLGVAKLQMQDDLHLTDWIIGLGAGIFFWGYLLLDLPGSLLVERWSARKLLTPIMISWGVVESLMAFLGTPLFGSVPVTTQFYGLRLLLGITEAGFFPGVVVYLSHWYRLRDRSRAQAYFMITQPISIAVGLPISRIILENTHWLGWPGWRWVFLLEGIPPILLGFVTWFYLTDRPRQAQWLPRDERDWLVAELEREEAEKIAASRVRAWDALRNPQILLLIAAYFLIVNGNQSLIFFLPSITEGMRSMPVAARTIVAALPYVCSMAGILLNGFWARRTGDRRWHTAGPMLATGVSLGLAILAGGHLLLVITFFCLAGLTSQAYLPVLYTIPSALLGKSAAAAGVGLICLGNLGGFTGPYLFGYLRTATGSYQAGLWVLAGCMLAGGALASLVRVERSKERS